MTITSPQRPSTEPPSPRSPGTSVQEYLDHDARPVPAALRYDINEDLGTADLEVSRYISRDWHDREVEKVWRRVWQFVCRTDHIPNPGDHITYDIADDKLIVMRQADGSIKALYNVCLHRGRALRQEGGRVAELRCPFHGFSWNIDGSLKNLPCAWDFPQVEPAEFRLPEARVAEWNGFVFINMDPDAAPLEDFLGTMLNDWERWDYSDRVVYSHFGGVVDCNWKVAGRGVHRGLPLPATHPQMMEWLGDENTQYDVIKGRELEPADRSRRACRARRSRTTSPSRRCSTPTTRPGPSTRRARVETSRSATTGRRSCRPARRRAGSWRRRCGRHSPSSSGPIRTTGPTPSSSTGSSTSCSRTSTCSPGRGPTPCTASGPYGNDPDRCIAEVFLLAQQPADGSPTPSRRTTRWLREGETFADIKEIGLLGPVFDQDMANMPFIQQGLKSLRRPGIVLARYQENRIRHYHAILDEWMARD